MTTSPEIFISWSGELSRRVAEKLRSWLPLVIETPEFWLSSRDLPDGTRWASELFSRLESSQFGILVVTPENISSTWMVFEAGALSKSLCAGRVIPYLVGITPSELHGPLKHFQAISADKTGTLRLIEAIRSTLVNPRNEDVFNRRFDVFWPEFDSFLATCVPSSTEHATDTIKDDPNAILRLEERLAETTTMIRELVSAWNPNAPPEAIPRHDDKRRERLSMLEGAWLMVPRGGHCYAKMVQGDLLIPYCYNGNSRLDAVHHSWQVLGEYWFSRFKWVERPIAGFAIYRLIADDVLEGSWWGLSEDEFATPAQDLFEAHEPYFRNGMNSRWERISEKEWPSWATDYFAARNKSGRA